MQNEWRIWQLVDSAFPTSGFAHSGGLEAAWQQRVVTDGPSLQRFIDSSRIQLQAGVLRFVMAAWAGPDQFSQTDEACDLFLNNHVANRASCAQGRAFLSTAANVFSDASIAKLAEKVRQQRLSGHLAPVFGAVARWIGFGRNRAASAFAFIASRSYLSSAVRLGIVGPIEAQRIQAGLYESDIYDAPAEPVQTSPFLDLLQATQDRLYSRLFQS